MPGLSILAQIARQAGDEILAMQADVVANKNGEQELKSDGSIVTTADKAANKIVCESGIIRALRLCLKKTRMRPTQQRFKPMCVLIPIR